MVKVNGRGLCLMDASDCLEQDVMPPINEVNSGSRGLLILHGCAWYDTDTRYELW
jgi:hypothetical protein